MEQSYKLDHFILMIFNSYLRAIQVYVAFHQQLKLPYFNMSSCDGHSFVASVSRKAHHLNMLRVTWNKLHPIVRCMSAYPVAHRTRTYIGSKSFLMQ